MSMIGQKFYEADGREFTCVLENARSIVVRHESAKFRWWDVEVWKRKLTRIDSGAQFYTEAQNLSRHRAEINRKKLVDLVATLRDDQVAKILTMFFQPVA